LKIKPGAEIMKKLLGIVVLCLMFCNYALAKSTKIDIKSFKVT